MWGGRQAPEVSRQERSLLRSLPFLSGDGGWVPPPDGEMMSILQGPTRCQTGPLKKSKQNTYSE